ncbi:hypothetical protein GGR52DRAFT_547945 [Hypoxylon sp. FL1284]|nr:hypothetical protein GGR52DRAFT_547945 [Hypoxylon sp. FL1284]
MVLGQPDRIKGQFVAFLPGLMILLFVSASGFQQASSLPDVSPRETRQNSDPCALEWRPVLLVMIAEHHLNCAYTPPRRLR